MAYADIVVTQAPEGFNDCLNLSQSDINGSKKIDILDKFEETEFQGKFEETEFQGLPYRSRCHYFWPSLSHACH